MRLAEVAAVKINDIDGKILQVRVNHGKGGKDRLVDIPSSLLEILRAYYKTIRPTLYLLVGEQNGKPVAHRTIQHIFHNARKSECNTTMFCKYLKTLLYYPSSGRRHRSCISQKSIGA